MTAEFRMKTEEEKWQQVHRIWCFGVFAYYMIWHLFSQTIGKTFATYYITAAIVMVTFCIWFRRIRDGWEAKLLGLYWIWFCIAKIVNGDRTLGYYYYLIISLAVCFCFLPVGIAVKKKEREKFLDWFSFVVGLFYAAMGIACIYTMVTGKTVFNPFSGDPISQSVNEGTVIRLNLLGSHANTTGGTFLLPLCLMLYQFFHCGNRLWRIPIIPAFLEFYLCIGLTFSRSNMGAVSVCVAMAVILLVLVRISRERKATRVLAVVLTAAVVVPVVYMSFSWSTGFTGRAAAGYQSQEEKKEEYTETRKQIETIDIAELNSRQRMDQNVILSEISENLLEDKRSFGNDFKTFNNRKALYLAVLMAYREEPLCMLTGSNTGNMLRYADKIQFGKDNHDGFYFYEHMHNFLLQVLMLSGIPGFLLVLAFCVLLLIRMVRVYFAEKVALAEKMLVLPLAGQFVHFMLEPGLFTDVGVQTLFFFLMAGMVIGIDREVSAQE